MEDEIQTKTKTKKMRILYPFHKLSNLWNKYRIHIIYLLIIINIVIWAIAYNHTTNFYDRYIYLLTKAQAGTQEVSIKDDTKVATTSKTEPQKGTREWVLWEVEQAGIDKEKVNCLITHESGWDPQARNYNGPGNIDLGLFQWNTKFQIDPGYIGLDCVGNVECETHKFIEKVKQDGNFLAWHGYTHNCQWLGTDPFKK